MASDELSAERRLVDEARVDADAFSELYRLYVDRVYAYAWRRTGSAEAAEDICSATFEAMLGSLDTFRWRPGGLGPWLFRIAANQVIAHYRREGRQNTERGQLGLARLHQRDAEDDLAGLLEGDDVELRTAIAALNPRYQRAIDLRYLTGLSPEEAARAAGLTKPAFAVVLSRALKALRRELEGRAT